MKKPSHTLLLLVILMLMLLPALCGFKTVKQWRALNGVFIPAAKPLLTDTGWFSQTFQGQFERYIEDTIGYRSIAIRLFNQLEFSLFNISHARGVVVGKQGYLFYEEGIHNYGGKNRYPPDFYFRKVKLFRQLQDRLSRDYGIRFLLVIAPEKAYYFPEYIPDRYLRQTDPRTKYQSFVRELNTAGVDYLDFNRWFMMQKPEQEIHLYPKFGSHWSSYASVMAWDSLSRYLSATMNRAFPLRMEDSAIVSSQHADYDDDMVQIMNLLWTPFHPELRYSRFHFLPPDSVVPPRILFIGDSFYWFWEKSGIVAANFSNPRFWYYNVSAFPQSHTERVHAYDLPFLEQIRACDLIILLQSFGGSADLGYGFLERAAAEVLYPEKLEKYRQQILSIPEWYAGLREKALARNEPLERILYRESIFCVNQEIQKKN